MAGPKNLLIARLPRRERSRLLAVSEPVQLELGVVLGEPGSVTHDVYFPDSGFISLVATLARQPALEVGMVGREGMLGANVVLGVPTASLYALVQGSGTARRIGAAPFRDVLTGNEVIRETLNRYVHVLMAQLATSAACTRFHTLQPRLGRWLLMSQDRAQSDSFHLTHEFLAYMLGVRRVGITRAANDMRQLGLIRYHRGEITVLDRAGLEAAACSCYAADRDVYDRLLA